MNVQPADDRPAPEQHSVLGGILLGITLVLVGVRPLVHETVSTAAEPFFDAVPDLPATRPTVSLWIALAWILLFGATRILRALGKLPRPRKTGLGIGWGLTALAAGVSCVVASDHRMAISTTLDWITLPLVTCIIAQLAQTTRQMRLVLIVLLASGCASAAECFDEYWVMHEGTVQQYESQREELWGRRGIDLDSYQVQLYERRVYDRSANAFFAFSNIAASYLILPLTAAAVLFAGARGVRRWLLAALFGGLCLALVLTHSRGGIVAAACAMLTAVILLGLGPWIRAHPKRAWITGWGVIALGLASVAAFGLARGYLPGGSLTYRWWYLEATARMVADHPLWGVGSAQFGRHYPRYKEIKSPEEIANPHNFLAQALAEWGPVGLAGVLGMLLGASAVLAGAPPRGPPPPDAIGPPTDSPCAAVAVVAGLGAAVFAIRIVIVGHWEHFYIVGTNLYPATGWFGAAILAARCPGRISRASVALLGAGLLAFLLHNLVSFSLFIPGSATPFFALLGVALAVACERDATPRIPADLEMPKKPAAAWMGTVVALGAIVVYLSSIAPLARSWATLQMAHKTRAVDGAAAERLFDSAAALDPLDPTPVAERMQTAGPMSLQVSEALANELIRRDPASPMTYRRIASMYLRHNTLETTERALKAYREVLERYPTNPEDHVHAAEIHRQAYELGGHITHAEQALEAWQAALNLDAQRDPLEVRRFSVERIASIQANMARLRRLIEIESD